MKNARANGSSWICLWARMGSHKRSVCRDERPVAGSDPDRRFRECRKFRWATRLARLGREDDETRNAFACDGTNSRSKAEGERSRPRSTNTSYDRDEVRTGMRVKLLVKRMV